MPYQVVVLPAVAKAVARLPKNIRARITERLFSLATDPRPPGTVKLTGQNAYRIRIADYRVIYSVEDDRLIVLVIDVGHRRDVYRRN